jgi:Trypsin-like peptidase domain
MALNLADIREYVVPLFVAEDPAQLNPAQPVVVSRDRFMGTAFFVTKNGVALTAGHCVPNPSSIPSAHAFLAVIWDGLRARAQQVQLATVLSDQDVAVLKIAHSPSKYLPVSFAPVHMGDDIVTIGVPLHSVSGTDYEYRCLKGNVTRVSKTLELSVPAPRGMSGSPILKDGKVVGVMSWNARAESLEDQSDEKIEQIGPITRVTKTVTMAVTNYGQAERLSALQGKPLPFTEGVAFEQFIANLNVAK